MKDEICKILRDTLKIDETYIHSRDMVNHDIVGFDDAAQKIVELMGSGAESQLQTDVRARPFPMQDGPNITWGVAEKIYEKYSQFFGKNQSLERIAKRGGFGWAEVHLLWKRKLRERT